MRRALEGNGPRSRPGEALQQALEARGAQISVGEAALLAKALLALIHQGLVVPASFHRGHGRPI